MKRLDPHGLTDAEVQRVADMLFRYRDLLGDLASGQGLPRSALITPKDAAVVEAFWSEATRLRAVPK